MAPVLTEDEVEEVEAEEVEVVEPEVVVLFLTLKIVSGTSRRCTWIGDDIIHQERDRHTEQILRNSLGGGGVERPAGCNGICERPAGERRVVRHGARDVSAEKIQVSICESSRVLCAHATLVCDRQCEVQSSHLTYGQRYLQFRRKRYYSRGPGVGSELTGRAPRDEVVEDHVAVQLVSLLDRWDGVLRQVLRFEIGEGRVLGNR